MIGLQQVSKSYGGKAVLKDVNLCWMDLGSRFLRERLKARGVLGKGKR